MVIEIKAVIIQPKAIKTADVEKAFAGFMLDFLDRVLQYAQEFLEKETNQITSNLLDSGRTEFDRKVMEGIVIFSAPYAAFVEFGTRPHYPPLGAPLEHRKLSRGPRKGRIIITRQPDPDTQPLDFWAWRLQEREGMHAWFNGKYLGVHSILGFSVWKKIGKEGSDAHPYLRPAIDKARGTINELAKKHQIEF
jgi:hypothetical protein